MTHISDLADKDFKATTINIFKELKKTVQKCKGKYSFNK